jgi:queuine tRNA-ribosyltransferase
MNWDRNILTDSGYKYTLFQQTENKRRRSKFKSHIDGSYHFYSGNVMEIQLNRCGHYYGF